MKWRDILIGAVASLLVTVLGGVAVYYATREPRFERDAYLVYSIHRTASFTGEAQHLSFTAVKVSNQGGAAAKNVSIMLSHKQAEVRDLSIDSSPGLKEASRVRDSNGVVVTYAALLPGEVATLNLLLSSAETPVVSVRSDTSRGVPQSASEAAPNSPEAMLNRYAEVIVPVSGVLVGMLLGTVVVMLRRRGYLDTLVANRNNTGFVLLHHGLVQEADEVLSAAVRSGRHDLYTLSNLATCKALSGDQVRAAQLLQASKFFQRIGHASGVVLFNEAVIYEASGQREKALDVLQEAIKRSPRHVRRYCKRSVHLESLRGDPRYQDLLSVK